jgi:CDP-paratose 2-epimerase
MKYLITGGCGFLGTNIVNALLGKNEIFIFDNLSRFGSYQNLEWLKSKGNFEFIYGDIRNTNDVEKVVNNVKPDIIYHFAGQVAMTTSILNPRNDFEINVCGTFNLLNAVRLYSPNSTVIYSSTNKVYGDLQQFTYKETQTRYECIEKQNGFDELVNLDFHSPYGTSKGSADQYMLDFSRIYGLKTVVFRHSSMYGGRQFATIDQGWVSWFTQKAIEIKKNKLQQEFTISGNGKQVRDLLFASDCVNLYIKAAENIDKINGHAFNIGGGINNSYSIIELFSFLETELEIKMRYTKLPTRESDQLFFVADTSKIKSFINWDPITSKETGIKEVIKWVKNI